MSYVTRQVAHCDVCGHEWLSVDPKACAKCKRKDWNRDGAILAKQPTTTNATAQCNPVQPKTTDAVAPTTPGRGKVTTTAKAEPKPTTEGWVNPFAKGIYGTKKGRDILSD